MSFYNWRGILNLNYVSLLNFTFLKSIFRFTYYDAECLGRISGSLCSFMNTPLIKGDYKDSQFNVGSILLGFEVFEPIGGGVNTWFRIVKFFPTTHLFAQQHKFWSIAGNI